MIRPAEPRDASRLAEILIFAKRTSYRPIFQDDFVSFNEMQVLDLALHYRDHPGALNDIYLFDDGIVKGMMHWGQGTSSWELKELYVDPFFQGEGVGRALMSSFLAHAHAQGMEGVFLWVLEKNLSARKFYESFGYHPSGERVLFPGTEQYLLQYTKPLGGEDPAEIYRLFR